MQPSTSSLRPPVDAVNPARIWLHLEQFSSSVRASGSPAEAAAFAYAQQVLDQAGYATRLLRHDAYISLPVWGSPTLDTGKQLPHIPVLSVAHEHAGVLEAAAAAGHEVDLVSEVDTGWRKIPLLEAPNGGGDSSCSVVTSTRGIWARWTTAAPMPPCWKSPRSWPNAVMS